MRIPGFYPTWLESVAPGIDTERELAMIVRHLDLKPGESVLDIGCGPGRFAPGLVKYGCDYDGLDGNEEFIAQALRLTDGTLEPTGEVSAMFHHVEAVDFLLHQARIQEENDKWTWDAAFSWLASIGYGGEDADRALFAAVLGALKPGGRFLIHALDPQMPLGPVQLVHESKDGPVLAEVCDGIDRETNTLHARHYYMASPVNGHFEGIYEETSQQLYDPERLRTMLIEADFEFAEFKPAAPPFFLCVAWKANPGTDELLGIDP